MVNVCAGTPPKRTAVAPVKLLPVMVTLVPKEADTGAKALMVGVAGGVGGAGVGAGVTETGSSDPVSFEQEMVMTDIISGSSQVIFFMTVVFMCFECMLDQN